MEEIVSKDTGSGKEQKTDSKAIPADPYANVKRELSDEELNSPAVQKLLLNEHDRMLSEVARLKQYEARFYEKDKDCAVLSEKLKTSNASEVLYTLCEIGGSALIGVSGVYWENKGWILLLIGLVFISGGVLYKFIKR